MACTSQYHKTWNYADSHDPAWTCLTHSFSQQQPADMWQRTKVLYQAPALSTPESYWNWKKTEDGTLPWLHKKPSTKQSHPRGRGSASFPPSPFPTHSQSQSYHTLCLLWPSISKMQWCSIRGWYLTSTTSSFLSLCYCCGFPSCHDFITVQIAVTVNDLLPPFLHNASWMS